MKKTFLFFLVLTALTACKKTVEKAEDNLLIIAITNGQWKVTNFAKGSINITSDFADYKFQFQGNKTVDAIKNGSVSASGTWEANLTNRTVTSRFPNAQSPLPFLNGVWTVTNNSWTFAEATQSTNNETYVLRLDKQ